MGYASLVSPAEGTGTPSSAGGLIHSLGARIVTSAGDPITVGTWIKWDDAQDWKSWFASHTGTEQHYGNNGTDLLVSNVDGGFSDISFVDTWAHCHRVINGTTNDDQVWYNNTSDAFDAVVTSFQLDDATGDIHLLQDDGEDGDFDGRVFGFYIIDGEYSPTDCTYDTAAGGQFQDLTGAALTNAWCFLTGENSGNVGEDAASTHDFDQSTGGGSTTLDATDVPPGYSAGADYTIDVNHVAYALTFQGVELDRNLVVDVNHVAYTLTMQGVELTRSLVLEVGIVSYALTFQGVELSIGLILDVGAVSYALTMQGVELSRNLVLDVGTLSYALTFQGVEMNRAFILDVNHISYALTFQGVDFAVSRAVVVNHVAYALSFSLVSLEYSGASGSCYTSQLGLELPPE